MTRYYYRRPNGNDSISSNCVSPGKLIRHFWFFQRCF
ncbi:hypothetical protein FGIG_10931 [Fasciola gigantica]|uniref:Uncharacterized protein n=1 Tax=Fasciola gigantica TaxID=46835 RepID=A0A504Z262_FASGI|nr:hypothetical protein FGIG_10931 [Fasciola gigantica]